METPHLSFFVCLFFIRLVLLYIITTIKKMFIFYTMWCKRIKTTRRCIRLKKNTFTKLQNALNIIIQYSVH